METPHRMKQESLDIRSEEEQIVAILKFKKKNLFFRSL